MENQALEENKTGETKTDPYNEPAPHFDWAKKAPRWPALDIARGFAICLMILSHCVKGVMNPYRIPDWGIVPIHLITKFSSSLFILVFGVSLAVFFLPHVNSQTWAKKRWWMLRRGLELMLWYKALTVVQMFQFYPKKMIINTLLFKNSTDFVEILSFYAAALLWLPFFLPLWARLGQASKIILIAGAFYAGHWLNINFDFWGYDYVKALLVENDGFYCFGQLNRGALIFLGLYIGDFVRRARADKFRMSQVAMPCFVVGFLFLGFFMLSNSSELYKALDDIAHNVGKHPWNRNFFFFSLGGSLSILGLCLMTNDLTTRVLKPVSYIGQKSLNAFILHIIIIFYFFRYYLNLHHKVTYIQSLGLTALCIAMTIMVLYLWDYLKKAFK